MQQSYEEPAFSTKEFQVLVIILFTLKLPINFWFQLTSFVIPQLPVIVPRRVNRIPVYPVGNEQDPDLAPDIHISVWSTLPVYVALFSALVLVYCALLTCRTRRKMPHMKKITSTKTRSSPTRTSFPRSKFPFVWQCACFSRLSSERYVKLSSFDCSALEQDTVSVTGHAITGTEQLVWIILRRILRFGWTRADETEKGTR